MTVNMGEGPADNGGTSNQGVISEGGNTPVAPVEDATNPMWSPLLEQLPQSLHGMVTPHLKEWDKNYTQSMQKVHSQYEPWKPFIENQVDPNVAYQSWQAIQNLEANPQGFVEAIIEHYGLQQMLAEQGQQEAFNEGEEELAPFDIAQDPEFQRVTGITEQMAQLLLTQHQQQQESQFDALVDQDLAAAKDKHGEFDEDYVLQRMAMLEEDADTAVQAYQNMVNNVVAKSRNPGAGAPVIMGSGGGTPSTATSLANLQPKDRRALIAQTLANAANNGG